MPATATQADLHDLQIAPDNVAFITVYNLIRCDLTTVGGARNGVIVDAAVQEVDMKTGLVRWEWHSLDHVGVQESHVPVPTKAAAVGLVSPQLDRPRARRRPPDLRAQHLGRLPAAGRQRRNPVAPRRHQEQLHDGSRKRNRVAARRPHATPTARSPSSTTARTRASTTSRAACASRSTRPPTPPAWCTPTRTPAEPLLADSQGNVQTLPNENLVIGWGSTPSVSELLPTARSCSTRTSRRAPPPTGPSASPGAGTR